ncbi:MAG TPA: HepT-like ribonuclease domain-containing protein, partial [Thermomicrobiales bacterium]|nr:HepT-like ribonuclease domain-containing protein [Thermomicrobiales bacterium]
GEALLRLERTDPPAVALIGNYRKIIGFRNRLVHGYYTTDQEQVWTIIHDFVPRLRLEVDALLMAATRDLSDADD